MKVQTLVLLEAAYSLFRHCTNTRRQCITCRRRDLLVDEFYAPGSGDMEMPTQLSAALLPTSNNGYTPALPNRLLFAGRRRLGQFRQTAHEYYLAAALILEKRTDLEQNFLNGTRISMQKLWWSTCLQ